MDVEIKDWTFTHWWVRPTVKVWFDLYHKTVTYSGTDHINWQKPVIFAPSHQNAFTDALCLILPTKYTSNRFIYPLIRADAFGQSRAIDWILTAFHMLPVYRPRDGVDLKQRNKSVFSHCHQILFQNRNLLIHPEGNCIPKKKVGRFKKGLARIALGAEAEKNFNLGVNIVPVGVNYRAITKARKGIHIRFGQPVLVSDYREQYQRSKAAAIADLTHDVEKGVGRVTVDIDTRDYLLTEQVVDLLKNNNPKVNTAAEYDYHEFDFEKDLIARLYEKEAQNQGLTDELRQLYQELERAAGKHNIDLDYPLAERKSSIRLTMEAIGYLILLPLFLYGWINNIIPWMLMHKAADGVKETQFKNSARMVAGLLFFSVSYLVQTAALGLVIGFGIDTLLYLFSLSATGIMSLRMSESFRQWRQQIRLKQMPQTEQKKLSDLLAEIIGQIKSQETAHSPDAA